MCKIKMFDKYELCTDIENPYDNPLKTSSYCVYKIVYNHLGKQRKQATHN